MSSRHTSAVIEIDSGIDTSNVAQVVAASADILVAGDTIFGTSDAQAATRSLRAAAMEAAVGSRA